MACSARRTWRLASPSTSASPPRRSPTRCPASLRTARSRACPAATLTSPSPVSNGTVPEPIANRLRSLLSSEVYTEKGRLRSDDLLIRQRVNRGLGEASTKLKQLISEWRTDRVPPSTRDQPFPPAEVMEPIRRAERLLRSLEDTSTTVNGLPVLSQDRVWDRVRKVGLGELLQFDWALVGEADSLGGEAAGWPALDELGIPDVEARIKRIRDVI